MKDQIFACLANASMKLIPIPSCFREQTNTSQFLISLRYFVFEKKSFFKSLILYFLKSCKLIFSDSLPGSGRSKYRI